MTNFIKGSGVVFVTDFGTVAVPKSPLLHVVATMANAFDEERTWWQRWLRPNYVNPARRLINRYVNYLNRMAELGYVEGKGSWLVDVLSFEQWLTEE